MRKTAAIFPITHELAAVGTFEGEDLVASTDKEKTAVISNILLQYATRQVFAADDQAMVHLGETAQSFGDAAANLYAARKTKHHAVERSNCRTFGRYRLSND